jgi:uncharacterized FlgJ-related protein
MSFNVDWTAMKGNLFDACKESVVGFVDESKDEAQDFYKELREFTDRVTDAKKELAEATGIKKKVKAQTLEHEMRNLDAMVTRYKIVFMDNTEERVKEVLMTAVRVVGKVAISMLLAAV